MDAPRPDIAPAAALLALLLARPAWADGGGAMIEALLFVCAVFWFFILIWATYRAAGPARSFKRCAGGAVVGLVFGHALSALFVPDQWLSEVLMFHNWQVGLPALAVSLMAAIGFGVFWRRRG